MNKDFMVYTLIGQYDYESSTVLGIFASYEDMIDCVNSKTWAYDSMTYVTSFIGQECDSSQWDIEIGFPRIVRA
jgi:hypothetical protein